MGSVSKQCKLILKAILPILALIVGAPPLGSAQNQHQKTFKSSKDAVDAFIRAVSEGDRDELRSILGPESEQIVSSGDDVADKQARDRFVSEYKIKHLLHKNGPDQFTLSVGNNDWPLPIPLVHANDNWYWDGAAGREELLYRRVGRNELSAIEVCKGVVAAQHEYASGPHDGHPTGVYATRIVSESGKQNGLYWEVAPGETPSPAGPLLARANAEGYESSGKRSPYHGYYYRMLKSPEGFGFLAYPARYRSSGVMTFIVNQEGIIYEKDLGENTAEIAEQMTEYHNDDTWARVK
jgi:hypothetical protein